ncbi:MAG: hypothetical protein IKS49_02250 [Actinomycetaceae bacterium]|nr:hypothetical protein [Actinomycetaceae bacterium]
MIEDTNMYSVIALEQGINLGAQFKSYATALGKKCRGVAYPKDGIREREVRLTEGELLKEMGMLESQSAAIQGLKKRLRRDHCIDFRVRLAFLGHPTIYRLPTPEQFADLMTFESGFMSLWKENPGLHEGICEALEIEKYTGKKPPQRYVALKAKALNEYLATVRTEKSSLSVFFDFVEARETAGIHNEKDGRLIFTFADSNGEAYSVLHDPNNSGKSNSS